ncbi:hypothetical protein GN956_G6590 [Arapaima gigas]
MTWWPASGAQVQRRTTANVTMVPNYSKNSERNENDQQAGKPQERGERRCAVGHEAKRRPDCPRRSEQRDVYDCVTSSSHRNFSKAHSTEKMCVLL